VCYVILDNSDLIACTIVEKDRYIFNYKFNYNSFCCLFCEIKRLTNNFEFHDVAGLFDMIFSATGKIVGFL